MEERVCIPSPRVRDKAHGGREAGGCAPKLYGSAGSSEAHRWLDGALTPPTSYRPPRSRVPHIRGRSHEFSVSRGAGLNGLGQSTRTRQSKQGRLGSDGRQELILAAGTNRHPLLLHLPLLPSTPWASASDIPMRQRVGEYISQL